MSPAIKFLLNSYWTLEGPKEAPNPDNSSTVYWDILVKDGDKVLTGFPLAMPEELVQRMVRDHNRIIRIAENHRAWVAKRNEAAGIQKRPKGRPRKVV